MPNLPVLGFSDYRPTDCAVWKDGTVVFRGILGKFDAETIARDNAERDYKQKLRDRDVAVLEDWRPK